MAAAAAHADASARSSRAGSCLQGSAGARSASYACLAADRPEELLSSQDIQGSSTGGHSGKDGRKRKRKAQRKGKTNKQQQSKERDGLNSEVQTKDPLTGGRTCSEQGLDELRRAALDWANKADAP